MSTYKICLHGCDDCTVFEMELTQKQYDLLQKVSEKSIETSTYGCMPTLGIEKVDRKR